MNNFVRKAVSFNTSNIHQRELYEWMMEQSRGNFSGYVKAVLYAHKNRQVDVNLADRSGGRDAKL